METALKGVPVMEPTAPEGVVNVGGEWYYEEYARGGGVGSLGVTAPVYDNGGDAAGGGSVHHRPSRPAGERAPAAPYDKSLMNSDGLPPGRPTPPDERRSILDLFRN